MKTYDFTADMTCARQGDVFIFRLPGDVKVDTSTEISPRQDGKLVLLEGEMTGHHHAIDVLEPPSPVEALFHKAADAAKRKASKAVEDIMSRAASATATVVHMYGDKGVAEELVRRKIMTRTDLYVGTLVVSGGADVGVVLGHQEHDGIRLTCGNYYIGRQIESAGAEERKVRD